MINIFIGYLLFAMFQFMENAQSNYLVPVGKDDYRRLLCLNQTYNSTSLSFLQTHIKKGTKVLDIACGIGILTTAMGDMVGKNGSVTGIDASVDQIEMAKAHNPSKPNVNFRVLNAYNLDELSETYDVICIRFLLIHLPNPEKILEACKKHLKPGGVLLIEETTGIETLEGIALHPAFAYYTYVDYLQISSQDSSFSFGRYAPFILKDLGYNVVETHIIHPILDTLEKRRVISLGMKVMKAFTLEKTKVSEATFDKAVKDIEAVEEDLSKHMGFYKTAQIAAVIN